MKILHFQQRDTDLSIFFTQQERAALHPRFLPFCVFVYFSFSPALKAGTHDINPCILPCELPESSPRGKESSKENKPKQPKGSITGMWVCYTHSGLPSLQQVLKICAGQFSLVWFHMCVLFKYGKVISVFNFTPFTFGWLNVFFQADKYFHFSHTAEQRAVTSDLSTARRRGEKRQHWHQI